MHVDIVIFAVITLILILKLKSVLGVKNQDDNDESHIFIKGSIDENLGKILDIKTKTFLFEDNIEEKKEIDESLLIGNVAEIKENILEIIEADKSFNVTEFVEGAKAAFEMIVVAYSQGDKEDLKELLSPKLYEGFVTAIDRRHEQNKSEETKINNIEAVISAAYLKGTMAYVTVNYDVEKIVTVKEADNIISDGEIIKSVDIWTFTRDTRDEDPNWILIETKVA